VAGAAGQGVAAGTAVGAQRSRSASSRGSSCVRVVRFGRPLSRTVRTARVFNSVGYCRPCKTHADA
jgi:hypothetical protein